MNTKSLLTRIGVPVLSIGLLGGLGATLATSASAAVKPVTVTANTHLNNHPDTTDISGGAILPGNVWAYDNATEKFTIVQTGDHAYTVTMDYVGSFQRLRRPDHGCRARQQRLGQGHHLLPGDLAQRSRPVRPAGSVRLGCSHQ